VKDPTTSLEQDVEALRRAVRAVAGGCAGLRAPSAFAAWLEVRERAKLQVPDLPGLVRQLGVALVERCAIDAVCRGVGRPFHRLLRSGEMGLDPAAAVPGLLLDEGVAGLPAFPAPQIDVRHTVGLSDPLDALPAVLAVGGVRRLKIKLGGNPAADADRLAAIFDTVGPKAIDRVTLDGNENYANADALGDFLTRLRDDARLSGVRQVLAWVEQPLHRDAALSPSVTPVLRAFPQFPHVLDESDDDLDRLPRALGLGYAGTTYKSCKGVFKSVLAKGVLRKHAQHTGRKTLLSGEDLTIVAPWTMAQDLAAAAALGVIDIERNGHHYADGLSAFPRSIADAALAYHPDLYHRDPAKGAVRLRLRTGRLALDSINHAPFGTPIAPPPDVLQPI
jgi:hypothetical protein